MIEVIPAINAESFEEVKSKIKLVEPFSKWVHLDIADGTFTLNTLWHNASDLSTLETPLLIEVHLMIADMDTRWQDWVLPKVDRIIFHAEAAHDPEFVLNKIKEEKKEVGVAIRPETDWRKLESFCAKADLVQTLAVYPGHAGQAFKTEILDKIKHIRESHPKAIIEADGGINLETGKKCVEAGANILVSANYIFGSKNIEEAINNLKNV
ncbi:hypothetical protein A3I27_04600 [Candidatus Giovannonibacteria bacterium RIFCSPLOWO2_02_FULL_43_11b]|uniref:Ribulose-phosphate 3-epimerase n=1 Tax=Candidatus Giovannonibacteria bacterium RIFCSPHIGHO2_12_FULL_43_15 TaxID=1798341 RepID=A0A1F5WRF3_9BACT|nr:MAG: hypothetical protein A2739_02340 [Candidatus Giovannonibacteria bacterium RIFCSPHIGHO2_01_FULL_43_100]OGF67245.1 MAG: hypothetical protein A3B97_00335 [Candidatus Giovannonibacteria bacterium RIFCSPHIGHO2_02_FULL_43_32]OGF78238.1 MAG: hypothetical protein A3F23_02295 [Candidatus Giovannonibacteria bacterium RIFCSPHIGHO2_12_FULL_43_15]OGF78743.1 MAG: hypothetical protein A3A15_00785 [Candidatus Giovannonibacteria bacterium RIFCSPLOWO2_01_FULL_43_60]OGF90307.1 MAG: hypothetical protein A3